MKIQFLPKALKGNYWSMVNSFAERTLGKPQTMSLCSDKNPISLDLHFPPVEKQPNDLFTFYTFTAGIKHQYFSPIILRPFSWSVSQVYFNFRVFILFRSLQLLNYFDIYLDI